MRSYLFTGTLVVALFLGASAFWMAHEEWDEYENGVGDLPTTDAVMNGDESGPLPLQELIRRLQLPSDTRILEVEKKQRDGRLLYEIELLTPQGRVYELLVDSHSGEVVEQEEEESHAVTVGGR